MSQIAARRKIFLLEHRIWNSGACCFAGCRCAQNSAKILIDRNLTWFYFLIRDPSIIRYIFKLPELSGNVTSFSVSILMTSTYFNSGMMARE